MNGTLELIYNAMNFLEPYNESDVHLFMHCTNNSSAITYCYFQDLQPVFECHGWSEFKLLKDGEWRFIS